MGIDRHHLRAYIFFLILSIILVGTLVYLYIPKVDNLSSNSVNFSGEVQIMSGEKNLTLSPKIQKPSDTVSERRIHFTKMLLRYQNQLNALENHNNGNNKTDQIQDLRLKIDSLQSRIAQLAR